MNLNHRNSMIFVLKKRFLLHFGTNHFCRKTQCLCGFGHLKNSVQSNRKSFIERMPFGLKQTAVKANAKNPHRILRHSFILNRRIRWGKLYFFCRYHTLHYFCHNSCSKYESVREGFTLGDAGQFA